MAKKYILDYFTVLKKIIDVYYSKYPYCESWTKIIDTVDSLEKECLLNITNNLSNVALSEFDYEKHSEANMPRNSEYLQDSQLNMPDEIRSIIFNNTTFIFKVYSNDYYRNKKEERKEWSIFFVYRNTMLKTMSCGNGTYWLYDNVAHEYPCFERLARKFTFVEYLNNDITFKCIEKYPTNMLQSKDYFESPWLRLNGVSVLYENIFKQLTLLSEAHRIFGIPPREDDYEAYEDYQRGSIYHGVYERLYDGIDTLEYLDIDVKYLPDNSFLGLDNLTKLHVYQCETMNVSSFSGLRNLTELEISYGKINVIQNNLFSLLPKLCVLIIV